MLVVLNGFQFEDALARKETPEPLEFPATTPGDLLRSRVFGGLATPSRQLKKNVRSDSVNNTVQTRREASLHVPLMMTTPFTPMRTFVSSIF